MKRISGSAAGVLVYSAIGLTPAHADDDWDRYANSDYQYCDAVILGQHWGQSVDQAKTRIGRKLGWGDGQVIANAMRQARSGGQRCSYSDTGFDYSDAQAVSILWGSSVSDAKSAIADKVSLGNRHQADQWVAEARALGRESLGPGAGDNSEEAAIARYAASQYQYCDTVMLGAYWGESAADAKVSIGRKIGWGNAQAVADALVDARSGGNRCQFVDTGFQYADAQALAALWGSSIADAKSAVADKVSLGSRDYVTQQVSEARNARRRVSAAQQKQMDAQYQRYASSHYEYCDAVMLGSYWQETIAEAKHSIGQKLISGSVADVESALSDARRDGKRCGYSDTGFSLNDAELMSRHWRRSLNKTKSEIAERVSMGERASVEELIRVANSAGSGRKRY